MTRFTMLATMALGLALGSTVQAGTPAPVTACGQQVQGTGQLVADLDCTGSGDEAVKLDGTLLLNGFTLTGDPSFDVVRCVAGGCRVIGPGTVTGGADGVRSDRGARVEGGATVSGNAGDGVRTEKTAKITGATISGNGGDGVRSKGSAVLKGAIVHSNGGSGVRTDGTANVQEISDVSFNAEDGIHSQKSAKLTLSSAQANGFDGVRGVQVQLKGAFSQGNGTDPSCGVLDDCADVAAELLPKLKSSTCLTSRNTESGLPWGVCAND